jgi:inner membrane protein
VDNISHTLVSLMVGEAAHRFAPASAAGLAPQQRRTLGVGLMILGNNLPDADFIYPMLTGSKLDYLLQHRGYTHTIVGALLISVAMLSALWLWCRSRHRACSRADAFYLALLALLAPLLHLAMDYSNSYGVHPFWPVNSSWHYGDAVFIVEPLFWACATPLVYTLRSRLGRAAIVLILLAGVGMCLGTGLVPGTLVAALVALMLLLGAAGRLASERVALASGIVTWLALTAMFFVSTSIADARIAALALHAFPTAHTLDRVLTPLPVNPICRDVLIVQTEGDRFVIRKAVHSIAPGWMPVGDCPSQARQGQSTARLRPTPAASDREISWLGEIGMPRGQLAELSSEFCAVRSLLHFARAPWVSAAGPGWIVGDLRYDREAGLGFAEIYVAPASDECPSFIPAWIPPRTDLLRGR